MNPVYEHAEFAVESGMGSRLESEFDRVRELLLRAKGCRSVELARSVDVADTYLLRVGWESLAGPHRGISRDPRGGGTHRPAPGPDYGPAPGGSLGRLIK